MVLEYQNKFDNSSQTKNTGLTSLRDAFTKMESQFLVTRRVDDNCLI